jgi:hypothetical protein
MFEFAIQRIRKCFTTRFKTLFFKFSSSRIFKQNNFNGNIKVPFEVDATGFLKLFVDANEEL